jgi:hypothetical protein
MNKPVVEDFVPSRQASVGIIAGPPGSGKTTVIRRLINVGRKVLVIDTDIGLDDTLADLPGQFKRIRVKTMADFYAAVGYCITELPPEYVVVVDSLSRLLFNYSREVRWGDKTNVDEVPDNLTLPQHGKIGNRAEDLFYFLNQRKIGHHCILLAHEDLKQDETGKMYHAVKMPGKKAYSILADKFDYIFRAHTVLGAENRPEHRILLHSVEECDTKLRLPEEQMKKIPLEIGNTEFGEFFNEYLAPQNGAEGEK